MEWRLWHSIYLSNKLKWQCQASNKSTSWLIKFEFNLSGKLINKLVQTSIMRHTGSLTIAFVYDLSRVGWEFFATTEWKYLLYQLDQLASVNLSLERYASTNNFESKCLTCRECHNVSVAVVLAHNLWETKSEKIYSFTTHALMHYSSTRCVRFQLRHKYCNKFH